MTREEYLLACVAEEAVEVAQRATKALRFGLLEIQPGQALTNRERLLYELTDLLAVIEMLGIGSVDQRAFTAKRIKVERFMDYSRSLGILQ